MTTKATGKPKWKYIKTSGPIVRCDFRGLYTISVSKEAININGALMTQKPETVAWAIALLKEFIGVLREANEAHKAIGPGGDHAAAKTWVEKVNGAKP